LNTIQLNDHNLTSFLKACLRDEKDTSQIKNNVLELTKET